MSDNRLSYIAEHLNERKLGPDDTFQFHCNQCGKCCINREDIILNPFDVYRAAKELGMSTEEFITTYGDCYMGDTSKLPLIRLRPRGSIRRCPLLKDRKCSIHKAKPTVCAIFPLGRAMPGVKNDKTSGAEYSAKETIFFFNPPGCGDRSETHTVREWLSAFGIPVEDEFFAKWQTVCIRLSAGMRRIHERHVTEDIVNGLLNDCFTLAYVNYDTSEEFLPQFERNAEDLLVIADVLNSFNFIKKNRQ